jgi:hypothetical protein
MDIVSGWERKKKKNRTLSHSTTFKTGVDLFTNQISRQPRGNSKSQHQTLIEKKRDLSKMNVRLDGGCMKVVFHSLLFKLTLFTNDQKKGKGEFIYTMMVTLVFFYKQ